MKAVILAAGQIQDYQRVRGQVGVPDLLICADGGIRHAAALGWKPDLILGDFDSADPAQLAAMRAQGAPTLQVPVEKDLTDTHLALQEALRRGATEIWVVGATGGRLDHTLANLLLLPGVPAEVGVVVADGKNTARLLRPGDQMSVLGQPGDFVSLLPLSPKATGVEITGVRWPLHQATLRWGESLGVSNRLLGTEAHVAVGEGFLLVIQAAD